MNTHPLSFRTSIALASTLVMLLSASSCPKQQVKKHTDAWVANEASSVTFMQFEGNGETVMAHEIYSSNGFLDGIKLEMHMTCTPQEESLTQEGEYTVTCKDLKLVRSTHGVSAMVELLQVTAHLLGGTSGDSNATMTMQVKVKGDAMEVSTTNKKGRVRTTEFTRVSASKVKPFLKRFREDTVEVREPVVNQRERDLP